MKKLLLILLAVCTVCPVVAEITNNTGDSRVIDRLTVLRGMAQTIIVDSARSVDNSREGLARMGDSIDMNAVPDTIRQIQQNTGEKLKGINDRFESISSETSPGEAEVQSLLKDAEIFAGVLKEDNMIAISIQGKLDRVLAGGSLSASKKALVANYLKMTCDCKRMLTEVESKVAKMLAFKFKNQHK